MFSLVPQIEHVCANQKERTKHTDAMADQLTRDRLKSSSREDAGDTRKGEFDHRAKAMSLEMVSKGHGGDEDNHGHKKNMKPGRMKEGVHQGKSERQKPHQQAVHGAGGRDHDS